MTIVARLQIQGVPILISDLLITGAAPTQPVRTPMRVDMNSIPPAADGAVPRRMLQKLVVIDSYIMFGWAVSVEAARRVIPEIIRQASGRELSLYEFQLLVGGFQEIADKRLQIIGWLLQDGVHHPFHFGDVFTKHIGEGIGTLTSIGSGRLHLEEELVTLAAQRSSRTSRTADARGAATEVAVGLATKLLNSELLTQETLRYGYGAGYEIATSDSSGYRKVDNVDYVFWIMDLYGPLPPEMSAQPMPGSFQPVNGFLVQLRGQPMRVCRYRYVGDVLAIDCLFVMDQEPKLFLNPDGLIARPVYDDQSVGTQVPHEPMSRVPVIQSILFRGDVRLIPDGSIGGGHSDCRVVTEEVLSFVKPPWFSPDFTDTTEETDNAVRGVSWEVAGSIARSSNWKRYNWPAGPA